MGRVGEYEICGTQDGYDIVDTRQYSYGTIETYLFCSNRNIKKSSWENFKNGKKNGRRNMEICIMLMNKDDIEASGERFNEDRNEEEELGMKVEHEFKVDDTDEM